MLMLVSIGSYVFINSIQVSNADIKCGAKQELSDIDEKENNAELPDVKILKKIIEQGRKLIPVTRF